MPGLMQARPKRMNQKSVQWWHSIVQWWRLMCPVESSGPLPSAPSMGLYP